MKKPWKLTYWVTTIIVSLMMLFSTYSYLTNAGIQQAFTHLGYPDHFRIELAIAKLIGAIVLLALIKGWIKEWAYAGFAITFVSAFIAHTASGNPMSARISPVIFLGLLIISFISFHKTDTGKRNAETKNIS
ncbi:DoxX family protein [Sinomicrobium sp. M5D2P9]